MVPDTFFETIVALASAPGPGRRAIARLSGPAAEGIAFQVFSLLPQESLPEADERPEHWSSLGDLIPRHWYHGKLTLPGLHSPLPADLYLWRAPNSYTGQVVVEIHTLSIPPLVDLLIAGLLNAGARAARPGEFTMRAFLAGKLDLTRAEAVAGVIEARNRDELKHALTQLAGGVSRPLQEVRDNLLDLLADVEAGLDFSEEDIHFAEPEELLKQLARGMAHITLLLKQFDKRSVAGPAFRVALVGRPNAGKSSLFNVLADTPAALVSSEPGTTRDYLVRTLRCGEVEIELVDTAGLRSGVEEIETQAQALGQDQRDKSDLILLCLEAGEAPTNAEDFLLRREAPPALAVGTKADLGATAQGALSTSAVTGLGLGQLRTLLAERAGAQRRPALAPSLSRCRHHVVACLDHLRQAHAVVLHQEPPELLALELRGALDQLGEMVGAVYTDDLLDRIFSRFCIGK